MSQCAKNKLNLGPVGAANKQKNLKGLKNPEKSRIHPRRLGKRGPCAVGIWALGGGEGVKRLGADRGFGPPGGR